MGGALGGADQEPSFLLSTQTSSPQLTPTPASPPLPSGNQALLLNRSHPSPSGFSPPGDGD